MKKIETNYWAKPIPTDKFDWQATFDDYDPGEPDGEDGTYRGGSPIGHGATEQEAIDDLLAQVED